MNGPNNANINIAPIFTDDAVGSSNSLALRNERMVLYSSNDNKKHPYTILIVILGICPPLFGNVLFLVYLYDIVALLDKVAVVAYHQYLQS